MERLSVPQELLEFVWGEDTYSFQQMYPQRDHLPEKIEPITKDGTNSSIKCGFEHSRVTFTQDKEGREIEPTLPTLEEFRLQDGPKWKQELQKAALYLESKGESICRSNVGGFHSSEGSLDALIEDSTVEELHAPTLTWPCLLK